MPNNFISNGHAFHVFKLPALNSCKFSTSSKLFSGYKLNDSKHILSLSFYSLVSRKVPDSHCVKSVDIRSYSGLLSVILQKNGFLIIKLRRTRCNII